LAELPELTILSRQMHAELAGKAIAEVETPQPKCLNVTPQEFAAGVVGRTVGRVELVGKWIALRLSGTAVTNGTAVDATANADAASVAAPLPGASLLLNVGMGADVRHFGAGTPAPAKYQFRLVLDDGSGFTARFWWFGYVHLVGAVGAEAAAPHPTGRIGPLALAPEVTLPWFAAMVRGAGRRNVKDVLLDQHNISGIGNAYMHDILWHGRTHPRRRAGDLSDGEIRTLYDGMHYVLRRATELGGWERDFYGAGGNMDSGVALTFIGYAQGKPCPRCGTTIEKIKTGSTAAYICPACQPL
jgi:formamidopyrimidine-DNA glycosylase